MSNITTVTLQHQDGVPPYLLSMMYFIAVVLPKLQVFLSIFMVVLGTSLFAVGVYMFLQKSSKCVHDYIPLKMMSSSKSDQRSNL
jgi:hypothetical protein